MRFMRRALTGLFLTALTIGLLAFAGGIFTGALEERAARDGARREAAERVFAATVTTVEPGTITPILTTFGEIQSRRTLEVRATGSGRITELGDGVEEGARVSEGDLLFRIDPVQAERELAVAEADLRDSERELDDAARALDLAEDELASAEDQVALRARALERQRNLEARGVGAAANVEGAELELSSARQAVLSRRNALNEARTRINGAETRIERSRIALDEAERALADTRIEAAFGGVLSEVTGARGGLVAVNERLAELIDPGALEVAFRLSTAEYARLLDEGGALVGAPVDVVLRAGGFALQSAGRITRESGAVGEGQSGRRVFASLDDAGGFRAGDFAEVRIEEPALGQVARLPAAAVDSAGRVLVLGEDDRLSAAEVQVLRREEDTVLVRAPQIAGREVVARQTPSLGPGIMVRPIRPEDLGTPEEARMLELSDERRARLLAFVEASDRMPVEAKERVLSQLRAPQVPAQIVARIEGRMGG